MMPAQTQYTKSGDAHIAFQITGSGKQDLDVRERRSVGVPYGDRWCQHLANHW